MAGPGSSLALSAFFEAADPRFLGEVQKSTAAGLLGPLAERWLKDPRPELRRQLLEYVDGGLERPNHQPLVKRLFKGAEAAQDHELMAHFLVACDRLMRRQIKTITRWDWTTRTPSTEEVVKLHKTIQRGRAPTAGLSPVDGQTPKPKGGRHFETFTYGTRCYLQRRAWRYFRSLAQQKPEAYLGAIGIALQLYQDEHLATPMQLLDSWGLVHALYHHSPVLMQTRAGFSVAPEQSLAALAPAPYLPQLWGRSVEPLFDLVIRAQARTVRLFAMQQLQAHHGPALAQLSFTTVRRLLSSPDPEVQTFAASLLEQSSGVAGLPVAEWLQLLALPNPAALPILCEQFARYVAPERVSTAQLLELALQGAGPVAQLAVEWLVARPVDSEPALRALLVLGGAPAQVARSLALPFLLKTLQSSPFTQAVHLRELIDAPHADVRAAGLGWMLEDPRFRDELLLWTALSETPYDDVRATFLLHLSQAEARLPPASVERVWASVILAVHRGNRAKAHAVRQVAERIALQPGEARRLLPLLQVGLRSLRAPERKGALAALVRATFQVGALRELVAEVLPQLRLETGPPERRAP